MATFFYDMPSARERRVWQAGAEVLSRVPALVKRRLESVDLAEATLDPDTLGMVTYKNGGGYRVLIDPREALDHSDLVYLVAHESAHIWREDAQHLAEGQRLLKGAAHAAFVEIIELGADLLCFEWGFDRELQAFLARSQEPARVPHTPSWQQHARAQLATVDRAIAALRA